MTQYNIIQSIMSYSEFFSKLDKGKINTVFELGSRDLEDSKKIVNNFPSSTCHAFECNPDCLQNCKKTIATFTEHEKNSITLVEKAVSIIDGHTKFHAMDLSKYDNMGASSMYKLNFSNRSKQDPDYGRGIVQHEIMVPAIRLDTYMKQIGMDKVDLLCIDLQGYELNAIKSLGDNIRNVSYIITECSIVSTYEGGAIFSELDEYLSKWGFKYAFSNLFKDKYPNLLLNGYSEFDALFERM